MRKSLLAFSLVFILALISYFVWSVRDKDLKTVPQNADAVILIDVKSAKQQYIFSLLKHPSLWFSKSKKSGGQSGVEVPDYIQIFHVENTGFAQWFSVLRISDQARFLKFLEKSGFKKQANIFVRSFLSVKIDGSRCIVGLSHPSFGSTAERIALSKNKSLYADQLINNSVASISFFEPSKILKFPIYLNDNEIEIKTKTSDDIFSKLNSDLEKQTSFIKLKLDAKNVRMAAALFNSKSVDSLQIDELSAIASLEMVKDKIVAYAYDENFDQVEKVSYQTILQPNYLITLKSSDPENIWFYFKQKHWINSENQFAAIPFQPNLTSKRGGEITVRSTRKKMEENAHLSGNYIYVKNSANLMASLKSLSKEERQFLSGVESVFYGNKGGYYTFKVKFKETGLPLILR